MISVHDKNISYNLKNNIIDPSAIRHTEKSVQALLLKKGGGIIKWLIFNVLNFSFPFLSCTELNDTHIC